MQWTVKQIFEDDYGCEEPAPGAGPKVLVLLRNEAGDEVYRRADDARLYSLGIDEGSVWPFPVEDIAAAL